MHAATSCLGNQEHCCHFYPFDILKKCENINAKKYHATKYRGGDPLVQPTISANPGLKFNPLFWFMYLSAFF